MRRHEPADRQAAIRHPRGPEPGPARRPGSQPADEVLALQRSAGNRAVSALLARQPVPTAPKTGPEQKRGATMTVGLGDEFVIPVDSMQWTKETEVSVYFDSSSAATRLHRAHLDGKRFETGFASTYALMSRLTDVLISEFRYSGAGEGSDQYAAMTLEAKSVEHEPVK